MQNIHDSQQRQLALDMNLSFIVQAPAGSGKTELLTQRFLALLATVKQPEEIIAITFTKKSAAEMRARIINALMSTIHQPEPELSHAKNTWNLAKNALKKNEELKWNLLKNPNRLRIQTIDSLNTYITHQLPILANFGSRPHITDDSQKLYALAANELLSHLDENVDWANSIAKLVLHLDNDLNKVKDLLINMLAKRDQWLPYIALNAHDTELRKTLERNLQWINHTILKNLISLFPKEYSEELTTLLRFAAHQLTKDKSTSIIIHGLNVDTLPNSNNKNAWLAIAELLLTKEFEWRKRFDKNTGFPAPSNADHPEEKLLFTSFKQRINNLMSALNNHEDLKNAFKNLCLAPDESYKEHQWEILNALHHVLRIAVAQLSIVFQEDSQIDFIENAQAALTALGTDDAPTDLTLTLDYQIKHLLIDEFQDISQSQFRLIEKLTMGWENHDGRTLFLVGDPMQSIYRFREAEVGLFIRARKTGLGNIKLFPLTLSVNFRSTPNLVNWVNHHFQPVFPACEDITMGAVQYSPSVASANDDNQNTVCLHSCSLTNENQQANAIINLIKHYQATLPHDGIAILVRARSHLITIIKALKKASISYRAIDIDPLDSRPVIQDLMALTRALLHPADRIAWFAILRAPWCGLSLADLLSISKVNTYQCLWDNILSVKTLSPDGQNRLNRILPTLTTALANRYRFSLRLWIENTWLALGGPACVTDTSDLEDAKAYFDLLDKLDTGAGSFDANYLATQVKKLFASPDHHADNSLQIMTIHNSKGLEFDIVILPQLERKAPNDPKQLLLWMEQPQNNNINTLTLAPIPATEYQTDSIYDYIKRQHAIKDDHETSRLLYVAATRAKKYLHLFFSIHNKENYQPAAGSFLEKLWPVIKNNITLDNTVDIPPTQTLELFQRYIKRLTLDWKNPIDFTDENVTFQKLQSGFKLPNYYAKYLGIIVHELLQYLCRLGIDWWQTKSLDQKKDFLKKRFLQGGLPLSQVQPYINQALLAIKNTLTDPTGRWILQKHSDAESEFQLTIKINGKIQSIVIDRTFIDDNNTRWIIDFKTSVPHNDDLNSFIETEKEKYLNQLQLYCEAMKIVGTSPIKMGLYFPLVPAWREVINIIN